MLTKLDAISRKSFLDESGIIEGPTEAVGNSLEISTEAIPKTSFLDDSKIIEGPTEAVGNSLEISTEAIPKTSFLDDSKIIEGPTEAVGNTQVKRYSEEVSDNLIHNVEKTDTDVDLTLNSEQQQALAEADEVEKRFEILLGCRKLPDILTIGFEKCGTDTLDSYLGTHPQIFFAREGYYQLFNKDSTVSVHEYTKNKTCTPAGQLRLNKLATTGTTENTHKVIPNAKLLAIVKEPVDRAMSHYVHRLENGMEDEQSNFDSVIASILDQGKPNTVTASVLFRQSRFLERLTPWIVQYGLDKIHIVDGDNFVKNPVHELQKVERFLGLTPFITEDQFVYIADKGFYCLKKENDISKCMSSVKGRQHPQMSDETRARLEEYFKPLNEDFFKTFRQNFSWHY